MREVNCLYRELAPPKTRNAAKEVFPNFFLVEGVRFSEFCFGLKRYLNCFSRLEILCLLFGDRELDLSRFTMLHVSPKIDSRGFRHIFFIDHRGLNATPCLLAPRGSLL